MASILKEKHAAEVFILDIDQKGLRNAQKMGLDVILGSAVKIPLAKNSVDGVFCLDVIEHIVEFEKVFDQVAQVIKPGGFLLLTTTTDNFSLPFVSRKWINRKWGHIVNGFSNAELEKLCQKTGFKIIAQGRYFNFFSRLAYAILLTYRFPLLPQKIREDLFEFIIRSETKISWDAREHWIIAIQED